MMANPLFTYLYVAAALTLGACTDPTPPVGAVTLDDAAARALHQSFCSGQLHKVDGAWRCASADFTLTAQCVAPPSTQTNPVYCIAHDAAQGRAIFGVLRTGSGGVPAFEPWLEARSTDATAPSTPCTAGVSNLHQLTTLTFDAGANRIVIEASSAAPLSTALACGRLQNADFSAEEEPHRAFAQENARGLLRAHERSSVKVLVSYDAGAADIARSQRINLTSDEVIPKP